MASKWLCGMFNGFRTVRCRYLFTLRICSQVTRDTHDHLSYSLVLNLSQDPAKRHPLATPKSSGSRCLIGNHVTDTHVSEWKARKIRYMRGIPKWLPEVEHQRSLSTLRAEGMISARTW